MTRIFSFTKKFLIVNLIVISIFSNVPFAVYSGVLATYFESRNIVDKFWIAQSDGNIVDNLDPWEMGKRLKVETAYATTGGQLKLYFHKEPADKNETYNSLSFTPPEPGADTANGTLPATNTFASALCESSQNAGETYNKVYAINNSAAHEGCIASFISPPVGQAITVSVGDTAPTAVLWGVDSVNTVAGTWKVYLYKWDGTTLTLFNTLSSVTDPSTTITSLVWTASAFTGTSFLATDRIVAIATKSFTSTGTGNSAILFDTTARAASQITLKYTPITPNKPVLTDAKSDDFTVGAATTACSTGGVAYNTKWTCLQGAAASTAGELNAGDAAGTTGDTSGWIWLNNKRTAVGAVPSNFGATPSNTFLYQSLNAGYGNGTVRTVVNTTMDYTIGATNPATPYSHSGLALWASNSDYLEAQVYSTGAKGAINTTYVALNNSGTLSGATSLNSSVSLGLYNRVWVGFSNTGDSYQAQYSTDGTTWNNLGSPVSHSAFTRTGLNSISAIGSTVVSQHAGAFEWFQHTFVNRNTLSDFVTAEPSNSIIAPGASGQVDSFGLKTGTGTDTVTAATVSLSAGMGQYIQTVAIINDGDTVTYCSAAPSGDTASLSSCTIPVTTTNTQFKIKLTAKAHSLMPAPAGGSYAVTGTITAFTSTNAQTGTDSGSATLTIDNASPNGATAVSGTAGNTANTINWTTSDGTNGPFDTTNGSVILRWASGSAGAEVPAEGNSTYTAGNTITTATVACVISSAISTAQSKVDGTGGSAGCTTTALTNGQAYTYKAFQRDTNGNYDVGVLIGTFTPTAPANTLTISASAGSKVANVDSGATSQFVHNTSCTTDGTCSAFKLAASGGAVIVTSITVTESSASLNADVELSNATLVYDTDANYSNGTAGTFGTDATFTSQAVTFTNAGLNIPNGSTYYFYIRTDFVNGANNPTGGATVNFQIANTTDVVSDGTESGTATLAGTTTIRPNVTSITYPDAGQSGGRVGESMTVNGAGFGVACDANNKVTIGAYTLSCTGATFNNTTISIAVDSGIPATNDGGTGGSGLLVTIGSTADDANQTYYVLPSITGITTCSSLPVGNKAREYASGDSACGNGLKDGEVIIAGTHFGSAGSVTILTQSATQLAVTGFCGDVAYKADGTCISVQVPATINDSTYTGNVVVTRTAGTKTGTLAGFRVLPRVASLVPSNGIIGTAVTVNGDHLCQAGAASCPVAFGANDKVTFTSAVDATVFTSWSNTAIVTAVPTGAVTGNVVVTSNEPPAYTSNALSFTVDANTTTLATGSDPAVNTIAPGASATDVDLFTLQTNGGTESVTSVTVNLPTNNGVGTLAITDNANTVLGSIGGGTGAGISAGSNVISVSGMSAGTGVITFKVRVTPLSHANMAVPDGGAYSITAPVTAWAGANTHAGSDTNPNALTIDNDSPAGTTGATPTAGDAQVQMSWSNPGDGDFQKVIIYCKTSSITETPTEGADPSVDGTACDGTARVKYSGSVSPQTITGLSNGTLYYFRIYARDTNGNFTAIASTQQVSATPTLTQTLTVGTVGTQATNLNSGSTVQHIGGAGTAAFTLQINTGSSNVTSVKVSETIAGFAIANLTNPKLYYENAANAASCAYGGAESFVSGAAPVGETITFTLPSVAVGVAANVTCLYFVSDVSSSAVGGQTIELQITNPSTDVVVSAGVNDDTLAKAITGTTTIRPNVTSITYPDAGQSGGRVGESMTVNGAGFGITCDANNKVTIGAYTLSCTGASFSNTTISIAVDSGIPLTNDGGTGGSGLLVTIGSVADDANQTYYVLPSITGITTCSSLPVGNKAREYASGDSACGNGLKDGEVIIAGTHFGSAGSVTILTQTATQLAVTGFCGDVAYKADGTCISAQVPATINDSTYTGNVVVTRTAGTKTGTLAGFRVLPRITSLNPSSASVNDLITVNGNHFCQSGACPGSFGANDKVTFNLGVDATYWGAGGWTDTAIDTKVPTGATTGDVVVTSDTPPAYTSNGSTFTLADATPTNPANEKQARNSGITDLISAGGYASSTPLYFSLDTSSSVSGGTMYAQIELRPTTGVNSSFTSVCTANPYCFETSGGLSYTSGSITVTASTTSITDDVHHWQARVRYNKSGTDYYSGWVPYSDPAFRFDTIIPVVTFTGADSCTTAVDNLGTNGARISWSFTPPSDVADGQVEYGTDSNLSGSTFSPIPPSAQSSNHAITLFNLNSNTPYYFKVRSRDTAGNLGARPSVSPYCSFTTSSNLFPAKTTTFYIVGDDTLVTNGNPGQYQFNATTTETNISQKSAFVTLTGIYETTNVAPTNSQITIQYESESANNVYILPGSPTAGTFRGYFKIIRKVNTVNTTSLSTLTVTPDANTVVYINSADIEMTYSYTP